jgi:hypothetical protein
VLLLKPDHVRNLAGGLGNEQLETAPSYSGSWNAGNQPSIRLVNHLDLVLLQEESACLQAGDLLGLLEIHHRSSPPDLSPWDPQAEGARTSARDPRVLVDPSLPIRYTLL